ncbi:MAG: hypothetical protein BIFFINMI_01887 [Phycisphaerae bacterium]|nr:hypothetical protein [Phycisphaerae bacterium]
MSLTARLLMIAAVAAVLAGCFSPARAGSIFDEPLIDPERPDQPPKVLPPPKPEPPDVDWKNQELSDERVRQAIARGIEWLWRRQDPREFHWEGITDKEWETIRRQTMIGETSQGRGAVRASYRGGMTALALLALRKCGADPDEDRYKHAVEWLVKQEMPENYTHAVRAVLLSALGNEQHAKELSAEKKWLLEAIFDNGGFTYFPAAAYGRWAAYARQRLDSSNTQYGHLAAWSMDDIGVEMPRKFWKAAGDYWLKTQHADGGWGYYQKDGQEVPHFPSGSYPSMTLAGLASLFVVWDKLYLDRCDATPDPDLVKAIDRGLEWVGKDFVADRQGRWGHKTSYFYMLYAMERVGVASGLKYFGQHNWYDRCARVALAMQRPDGSWPGIGTLSNDLTATSYALLFLSYGRAPVLFNKLACGPATQWNTRPRDLARLTTWLGIQYESPMSWQIMPLDRPVGELFDAPILFISGRTPLKLTDEEKAKLRQYVLGGGLIFGEAVGSSPGFSQSFRNLAAELFPPLEMAPLPRSHPIYSLHHKLLETQPGQRPCPTLEGVGNGVRLFMLLSPLDVSCAWQKFDTLSGVKLFQLGDNLVQYTTDRAEGLLGRGESYRVVDLGHRAERTVTIGRFKWGSDFQWNPEPDAWSTMDVRLRNARRIGIATQVRDFIEPVPADELPVAHLTGVGPIQLNDAQKEHLKRYVEGGGLLLVDAAGGDAAFADSFRKLAAELKLGLAPMDKGTPLHEGVADKDGKVWMRHVDSLPRATRPLVFSIRRFGDDGCGIVMVTGDLTAALVGYANGQVTGLTPASAERLVTRLIDWKLPAKHDAEP